MAKKRDRLQAEFDDECAAVRERLSELLDGVALALKGVPEPLTMHNWADLPAVAAAVVNERDWLLAEADDETRARFFRARAASGDPR